MARQRSAETRERDAKALGMRQRGLSLQQICEEIGYKSKSSAHEAIQRALKDCYREEAGEAVQLELERMDDVSRVLYRVMHTKHFKVSASGRIVRDGAGDPVRDDGPVVHAAMGLVKLSESRRKLLGIDAPSRSRVQIITDEVLAAEEDKLDKEIADLLAAESAAEADRASADADPGLA